MTVALVLLTLAMVVAVAALLLAIFEHGVRWRGRAAVGLLAGALVLWLTGMAVRS